MGRGANAFYNCVTLVSVILSILICGVSTAWISGNLEVPESLAPSTEIPQPTMAVNVLWTPSFTPPPSRTPMPTLTPTVSPTWTATPTQTATFTNTPLPSFTPSITPTHTPSSTQTASFTPSSSPTITLTPTPTGPTPTATNTRPPFAFEVPILNGGLRITQAANGNCNYTGFGGSVFDLSNLPVNGLQIAISGGSLAGTGVTTTTGPNPNFSPNGGGWEVQIAPNLLTGTFVVQLRNTDGTPLSPPITHTFSGVCEENLVVISFRQVAPY